MGVVSGTVAGTIGLIALAAAGGGYMASASRSAEKKKENIEADDIRFKEELANAPKPQTAEEKAKDGIRRARMIQQRTGGKTILADRYGGATETKSLLGE